MTQTSKRALALAVTAVVAVSLPACGAEADDRSAPTTTSRPQFSDFDPCADISPDFVTRRGLKKSGSYESANVVGEMPGRICDYQDPPPGYSLLIATTAAELGYPAILYNEPYEPVRIGGRDAEWSGPLTGHEDVYECRLLVDMAVGGLWFRFKRFGVVPGDPCADLSEIATEVVGMLPPGS